jgi:hypothetical protein
MPDNIKISELDSFISSPDPLIIGEDFFPLVNSSSMTTYRATIAEVESRITASRAISASYAISASNARTASYAISASNARTASYFKLEGHPFSFPYWDNSGLNGNLIADTSLYVSYSSGDNRGIITIDSASAFWPGPGVYNPTLRPDYTLGGWWNPKQNFLYGDPSLQNVASGLYSYWPIVSATFVGTDQTACVFTAGSTFWSGSSWYGVAYNVGDTGAATVNAALNGKWMRIAAMSYFDATNVATSSAQGEVSIPSGGFFGRIRLVAQGITGNQIVDFSVHDQIWDGGIVADVTVGNVYQKQIIQKLRLSVWHDPNRLVLTNRTFDDPMMALDVYIDNLAVGDTTFKLLAQSWGGVRFLTIPNVQPPDLYNTGSEYPVGTITPEQSSYLIFPPSSGHYTTLGNVQDYNIAGQNVVINPNRNQVTASNTTNKSPYGLQVSGTVNADTYYAKTLQGKGGEFVAYDKVTAGWFKMNMNGGILVNSSSTTTPPSMIGVSDVNGKINSVAITAGTGISVNSAGAGIIISATGGGVGITSVNGFTGDVDGNVVIKEDTINIPVHVDTTTTNEIKLSVPVNVSSLNTSLTGDVTIAAADSTVNVGISGNTIQLSTPSNVSSLNTKTGAISITSPDSSISIDNTVSGLIKLTAGATAGLGTITNVNSTLGGEVLITSDDNTITINDDTAHKIDLSTGISVGGQEFGSLGHQPYINYGPYKIVRYGNVKSKAIKITYPTATANDVNVIIKAHLIPDWVSGVQSATQQLFIHAGPPPLSDYYAYVQPTLADQNIIGIYGGETCLSLAKRFYFVDSPQTPYISVRATPDDSHNFTCRIFFISDKAITLTPVYWFEGNYPTGPEWRNITWADLANPLF